MPSINSNTGAMFSVNASRKTDQDMATSMKRLATGERITNAGDDQLVQQFLTECYLKSKD